MKQPNEPDSISEAGMQEKTILAQNLSGKHEAFIKGTVVSTYGRKSADLQVAHDHAFPLEHNLNRFGFYVVDTRLNDLFAVTAALQEDGTLTDYRCGLVPA